MLVVRGGPRHVRWRIVHPHLRGPQVDQRPLDHVGPARPAHARHAMTERGVREVGVGEVPPHDPRRQAAGSTVEGRLDLLDRRRGVRVPRVRSPHGAVQTRKAAAVLQDLADAAGRSPLAVEGEETPVVDGPPLLTHLAQDRRGGDDLAHRTELVRRAVVQRSSQQTGLVAPHQDGARGATHRTSLSRIASRRGSRMDVDDGQRLTGRCPLVVRDQQSVASRSTRQASASRGGRSVVTRRRRASRAHRVDVVEVDHARRRDTVGVWRQLEL